MSGAPGFAIIDVETSGMDASARVIELALIATDSAGRIIEERSTLLRADGSSGDRFAKQVHKISDEDLVGMPDFADVWDDFAALLNGRIVIAHNAKFDARMLCYELQRCDRQGLANFACTMELAYRLGLARRKTRTTEGLSARLSELVVRRKLRVSVRHRALGDARACHALLVDSLTHFPTQTRQWLAEHTPQTLLEGAYQTPSRALPSESSPNDRPPIFLVDAANVGAVDDHGREKKDYQDRGVWELSNYLDLRKCLESEVPNAIVLAFFDWSSIGRVVAYDRPSLEYDAARPPSDPYHLVAIRAPKGHDLKADPIMIQLAKNHDCFIITNDRFADHDLSGWNHHSRQVRFSRDSFGGFVFKMRADDSPSLVTVIMRESFVTLSAHEENRIRQDLVAEASAIVEDHIARSQRRITSTRRTRWLQRTKVRDRRVTTYALRAYEWGKFKRAKNEYVSLVGRLVGGPGKWQLEWFRGYRPIEVIPDDVNSFGHQVSPVRFIELLGQLEVTRSGVKLCQARIAGTKDFSQVVETLVIDTRTRIKPTRGRADRELFLAAREPRSARLPEADTPVPDVVHLSPREAQLLLRQHGFIAVGRRLEVDPSDDRDGLVVSQVPGPSVYLSNGSTVVYVHAVASESPTERPRSLARWLWLALAVGVGVVAAAAGLFF
jgi:DNA polymerase III epsilon subunit-like protein